jgi:hypothetical protein
MYWSTSGFALANPPAGHLEGVRDDGVAGAKVLRQLATVRRLDPDA